MVEDGPEEFSDFASRVQLSNDLAELEGGIVSHSARFSGPAVELDADVPPGLHLSCAIARSSAYSDGFGGFDISGAIVSALFVPDGGARFHTYSAGGPIRAFSYYLPLEEMDRDDPIIRSIAAQTKGQPLLSIRGAALGAVPRLTGLLHSDMDAVRNNLLQARGLELLAIVAGHFGETCKAEPTNAAERYAHRVRDDLEANLDQPNLLSDIARRNSLGVRTMTASFRSTFGESIGQYLGRRRMEEAAQALEDGASVHEVAYLVGYTPNAFSTAFKDHFDFSPSLLRRRLPD
ncbi:MAG: AraC family transcriptional regulator [Pseudomonadota bacterium]